MGAKVVDTLERIESGGRYDIANWLKNHSCRPAGIRHCVNRGVICHGGLDEEEEEESGRELKLLIPGAGNAEDAEVPLSMTQLHFCDGALDTRLKLQLPFPENSGRCSFPIRRISKKQKT